MRNAVLMVFSIICIFNSNANQAQDDISMTRYEILSQELNGLQADIVVIRAKLTRIEKEGFCPRDRCERIQNSVERLSQALNEVRALSVASYNKSVENAKLIKDLQAKNEIEERNEALDHECELVFPFGGIERYRSLSYIWSIPKPALDEANPGFVESPDFPLEGRNYIANTKLERSNTSYVMSIQFKGIATAPTEMPAVHYLQVDPSGQCLSAIYTDMFLFGGYLTGYNYFRPLKNVLSAPYVSSVNTVTYDVHVESLQSMQNVYSYTGILVDKVEDYSVRMRRIQNGLAMFYYGPYFYTAAQGYKINVRVYPGGQQKLTFLVCFLLGQFDAQLSANFAHTTTVTVYNQKNPALFLNSSVQQDLKNNNYYSVDVTVPQNFERDYLVDDTLFYKVVIKP